MATELFQLLRQNVMGALSTPDDIIIDPGSNGLAIGEPSTDKAMLEAKAAELQKGVNWYEYKFIVSALSSLAPLPPMFNLLPRSDNDNKIPAA